MPRQMGIQRGRRETENTFSNEKSRLHITYATLLPGQEAVFPPLWLSQHFALVNCSGYGLNRIGILPGRRKTDGV
jgi:hypothetical protein